MDADRTAGRSLAGRREEMSCVVEDNRSVVTVLSALHGYVTHILELLQVTGAASSRQPVTVCRIAFEDRQTPIKTL